MTLELTIAQTERLMRLLAVDMRRNRSEPDPNNYEWADLDETMIKLMSYRLSMCELRPDEVREVLAIVDSAKCLRVMDSRRKGEA